MAYETVDKERIRIEDNNVSRLFFTMKCFDHTSHTSSNRLEYYSGFEAKYFK